MKDANDAWLRRFEVLLNRRRRLERDGGFDARVVERDVALAVAEYRRAKPGS